MMANVMLMMFKLVTFLVSVGLIIGCIIVLHLGLDGTLREHQLKGVGMMGLSTISIFTIAFVLILVFRL